MKAIICHAPEDLRLDTLDVEEPGPHQLAVRVAYGGICGSDLHYFNHGGFGTVRLKEPMALGHEVSGVVSGLGKDVKNFAVGQRIAISPSRPCEQCLYCQKVSRTNAWTCVSTAVPCAFRMFKVRSDSFS